MNGSIMGMTKAEITRKLDEIVDFAGVERYLDTPVKRYSSGMTVRLGFAVAAFLEPEILVVDEVLTVGDAEFQKKAIGKMNDVATNGGRTVLFVSHNMAAVRALCKSGIVLKNGLVDYIGKAGECVDRYLENDIIGLGALKGNIIDYVTCKKCGLNISRIVFNDTESVCSSIKPDQKELNVVIEGSCDEDFYTDLMIYIKNKDGVVFASLAEGHCKGTVSQIKKGEFIVQKSIRLPHIMATGDYIVDIFLHHPMVEWQMVIENKIMVHIDGFQEECGRSLKLVEEGFLGLESI